MPEPCVVSRRRLHQFLAEGMMKGYQSPDTPSHIAYHCARNCAQIAAKTRQNPLVGANFV